VGQIGVILCVRRYLRFKLSFRDLVEMIAERGLLLAIPPSCVGYASTRRSSKRWNRFARVVGQTWRVDETYVKIRGTQVYLYRAVDRDGRTVDFRLSGRRDVTAAKAFFRKAIKHQGRPPRTITLDGYAASHRALREMKADGMLPGGIKLRSSKYLNNLVEQDHRGVKLRLGPMLRLKWFRTAAITIGGIELLRRIHKGQFDLGSLRRKDDTRLLYGMPCSQLDRYAAMWARCRPEQEFVPQPTQERSCKSFPSGGVTEKSENSTSRPARSGVQHIGPTT
jgi:transposase-like protein